VNLSTVFLDLKRLNTRVANAPFSWQHTLNKFGALRILEVILSAYCHTPLPEAACDYDYFGYNLWKMYLTIILRI
jgi:hypothetical protein